MSTSLPPALTLTAPHKCYFHRTQPALSLFLRPSSSLHLRFRSLLFRCSVDREEDRWLREEQRWLREEQRWFREEQRWARERDSLLLEISDLKLQIQSLERRILAPEVSSSSSSSVSDAIANVTALLQVLKDKSNLIAASGSSSREMVLEEARDEEGEIVKEVVVEDTARILGGQVEKSVEKRSTLRMGSEGEEVREMQEALLKLGFYSGEEDMEYSSFSSGTERAVKTWQAASGAPQDGIMTAELLEKLYMEITMKDAGGVNQKETYNTVLPKEVANGAPVASVTETSEFQQTVVGNGDTEGDASHQRVFLLGENRWEEPSRLGANEGVGKSNNKDATTKCLQCRGEGRLLCTECDGTGEPNIEPQFLEWVDEGANCPYCEGLGYIICDLCAGKTTV